MLILSIDPGIEKVGYAFLNRDDHSSKITLVVAGLIKTDRNSDLQKRFVKIYNKLFQLLIRFSPKIIVLERVFFLKNKKTAIEIGQAQGLIILLAGQKNLPIEFLTPLQVKQTITGYGQADKKAIQKMLKLSINLSDHYLQDDVADAIACGLTFCYLNKGAVSFSQK